MCHCLIKQLLGLLTRCMVEVLPTSCDTIELLMILLTVKARRPISHSISVYMNVMS